MILKRVICCCLLVLLFPVTAHSASIEEYARLPTTDMVAISPDGNLLAYQKIQGDSTIITVVSLIQKQAVFNLDLSEVNLHGISFFNNNQLYLKVSKYRRLQGFRGKFDLSTAYVLDIKTRKIRQLLTPGEKIYPGQTGLGRVVGLTADGKHALIPAFSHIEFDYETPKYSLYKVNLNKKGLVLESFGNYDTTDFFVDKNGKTIAREEFNEKAKTHKILSNASGKWQEIFNETTAFRAKNFVGITPDYKSLVFISGAENENNSAYFYLSLDSGKITGPILGKADHDIAEPITDLSRVVHGVRYAGFTPSYQFFDEQLDKKIKTIIEDFPEQSVWLSSWSPDWDHIVVNIQGSHHADDYFLYSNQNEAVFLTSGRASFDNDNISPIGRVTFSARDGLKIPTLITIPQESVTNLKNLPAIIYPHGGPASHDTVGFDFLAQALASQGYLVIQPQFRGSTGFGYDHYLAGLGEWGKKMQDDLTDTVDFFVSKNIINPEKVCIVGSSYGGYAALAGGAFTPEKYKCVVSINGVSDLNDIFSWDKSQYGRDSEVVAYMTLQLSQGKINKTELNELSPVRQAEKIVAPVLLMHASNDKRVPFSQSDAMSKALKKHNPNTRLIELEDDTHNLREEASRIKVVTEVVKFVNAAIGQ